MAENATYALTYVDGINAILFGHSHSIFPDAKYDLRFLSPFLFPLHTHIINKKRLDSISKKPTFSEPLPHFYELVWDRRVLRVGQGDLGWN